MKTSADQKDEGNDIEKGGRNKIENVASIKAGGWSTMPYIMGNETFEKLASMSLIANLVGMVVLAITAAIPHFRPQPCQNGEQCEQPKPWQFSILVVGLGFLVIGAGGIRPCNIAFGVDQFDTKTEKGKKQVQSFYNWYYLTFTLALLFALTVIVYIQNSVSWAWGLAIPATFMVLSVSVFLAGSRLYVYVLPKGSVFGSMIKVIVAAFNKRRLTGLEYSLYEAPTESESETKMLHTERFKYLDKAAIITEQDVFDDKGLPVNEWRLCSIKQVEQLKSLVGLTEALMGISLMEFFNSHLPASMSTVAGAFVFLNIAMAGYLNSCIVNSISSSGLYWLGGRDLNKNMLDYYYFVIGGLAVLNLIYFITFAQRYVVTNDSIQKVDATLQATSNKDNDDGTSQ
ncbi:NRT1/ PTR FAMILY 2.8 [Thalictrum thalictroides]|uniref:NRT1/ PTR FAMILY 2.8 n=1 Tax=Thalictrum thalictroides TaxID=46969 RepID=A0A7J6W051_THATH|nr:NRT1/ PTR FAMILY 2.8 [Thalictrum thalictroides]